MKPIPPHIPTDGILPPPPHRPATKYFLLMIVIGAASGFVASILYAAYGPTPTTKFETRIEKISDGIDERRVMNAQESVGTIIGAPAQDGAAYATAITSDGWFIADARAARAKKIVIRGQGALSVEKSVTDPATGLVFLKTRTQNLRVLDDESLREITRGSRLLLILPNTAVPLTLQDTALCITDKCPFEYSDQLSFAGVVVEQGTLHAADGAPIISPRGTLVGFARTQNNRLIIIPTDAMKPLFASVFTRGIITRASLAIRVHNTMRAPLAELAGASGMLVELLRAPHPPYNLKDGDIITHVAGQQIEAGTALFPLIQNVAAEKTVRLTIVRDEKKLDVTVPLTQK